MNLNNTHLLYNQYCPVCMEEVEIYQNASIYDVIALECGHAVHLTCAVQLEIFAQNDRNSLRVSCPLCRTRMILPAVVGHYQKRYKIIINPLAMLVAAIIQFGAILSVPKHNQNFFFNMFVCVVAMSAGVGIHKLGELRPVRKCLTSVMSRILR